MVLAVTVPVVTPEAVTSVVAEPLASVLVIVSAFSAPVDFLPKVIDSSERVVAFALSNTHPVSFV
ncbi:hypothetical protein AVENLUH13518_00001 [Acinetobacter venetianus]|uniref:Uncharacterized protein n=1 Tax=Acinetobacter venetianus TaxID=52133 RepID=A0A150I2B4_9GAMM|nr:hypothetical protein AVENLUH13518_00001 [Acinetobacter venetianus]